jgi:hypothetical protein
MSQTRRAGLFLVDAQSGQCLWVGWNSSITHMNEYTLMIKAVDFYKSDEFFDFFNLTIVVLPSNVKRPAFEQQVDFGREKIHRLFSRGIEASQAVEPVRCFR